MEMLDIYIDRDFYFEDGCMDFGVVDPLIQGFRELFGCFWKNPECVRDEFSIGSLLGGAGPSDRTSFICASEEWIVRHATPTSPEFQNEGLLPVSVYLGRSSKQYRVVFKPGSGSVFRISTSAPTFGRSGRGRGVLEIGLDRPSLPLKPSGPTDLPN